MAKTSPMPTIRLRVGYRSVESLVKEYTASLGRGGCLLLSRRPVATGARFLIEMTCDRVAAPVHIEGEVVRMRPVSAAGEAYELAVQYRASPDARAALDELLAAIEIDPDYAIVRQAPRIPVAISATDSGGRPEFVVRDLSWGGARIECRSSAIDAAIGDRVELGIHFAEGPEVWVGSRVRWTGYPDRTAGLQFGLQLEQLSGSDPRHRAIGELLALRPPSRMTVHLIHRRLAQHGEASLRRPRLSVAEVRAALGDALRRDPGAALGLHVVDGSTAGLFDGVSYVARVGLRGDVEGEFRVIANHSMATAVTNHVLGDLEWTPESSLLSDTLREFAVRLATALCSTLERSGYDVEATAPLPEGEAPRDSWTLAHCAVLCGERGLASVEMLLDSPQGAAAAAPRR